MRYLKGLVLALILANVGYFLWVRGVAPPATAPSESSAPRLRLASESASTAAPTPAAPSESAAASPSPAAPAATAPSDAATVPTPDGFPASAPTASPAPAGTARCISIGPFLDVAEAARAAATLRGGGYQPRQRVAEGDVWAGVWVYLDLPTPAAAVARMHAKLKGAGIDDALEMPGPKDRPVMSLGLFSEPKRAEARIQLARSLGFEPAVVDRKRTGDVYWVDVDLKPADPDLSPSDLDGGSGRIVRLQVVACPGR